MLTASAELGNVKFVMSVIKRESHRSVQDKREKLLQYLNILQSEFLTFEAIGTFRLSYIDIKIHSHFNTFDKKL